VEPFFFGQRRLRILVGEIADLAYKFVKAHNFARALEVVDRAIALAPDQILRQNTAADYGAAVAILAAALLKHRMLPDAGRACFHPVEVGPLEESHDTA